MRIQKYKFEYDLAYEKPTINIIMKKYNFNMENCATKLQNYI